ncbi:metal-dependent hydrolase [Sporosarcina obsidiansis]|uniref:metal-dependent hydrolase n=1 Tax=Sporosarcina obsidiansis TaxID=2660748 RepID=UPI00129B70F4|nr:metal-dependent hydrolase [Sporosarcina obsidiansis]
MRGTSHLVIGAAIGAAVGYQTQPELTTVLICTAVGGASALVPDLDTNGLATNRVTLSKKVSQMVLRFLGLAMLIVMVYLSLQRGYQTSDLTYGIAGAVLVVLSQVITQRRLLTLTGIFVVVFGLYLHNSTGIILAGSYIVIASFLPHRSYTHSIVGIVFYAFILHYLLLQWPMTGVFVAGLAGYASHIVADMKILPMNRRGVKPFAPLWNRVF